MWNNKWPEKSLPEYKESFVEMGKGSFGLMAFLLATAMKSVGILLSHHIDNYVSSKESTYETQKLERILDSSEKIIGRALHYFPQSEEQVKDNED